MRVMVVGSKPPKLEGDQLSDWLMTAYIYFEDKLVPMFYEHCQSKGADPIIMELIGNRGIEDDDPWAEVARMWAEANDIPFVVQPGAWEILGWQPGGAGDVHFAKMASYCAETQPDLPGAILGVWDGHTSDGVMRALVIANKHHLIDAIDVRFN